MAFRWERLLDLLTAWSTAPDHWVVLSGDRRTGKSTALRSLAHQCTEDGRPFVLWEYPEQRSDAPWDLLETPNALVLLDDWPTIHPDLRPPVSLKEGRGVIVTDAGPWRQPLTRFPMDTWPFSPEAAVVWVTLQRSSDRQRVMWQAQGAERGGGEFSLNGTVVDLPLGSDVFRVAGRTAVYAHPFCIRFAMSIGTPLV